MDPSEECYPSRVCDRIAPNYSAQHFQAHKNIVSASRRDWVGSPIMLQNTDTQVNMSKADCIFGQGV